MECNGKTALVTGAASGVGRAIATRLVAEGANVVLADIAAHGAQAAETLGERAAFIQVDITSESDVRRMVDFAAQTFGSLDILVNNAGGGGLDPGEPEPRFPDVDYEQWSRTLDLNLRAPMLTIQCALERMAGGGAIVNIASIAGVGAGDYRAPEYGTAKAGLIRLTACLTHLKAERNVRVNCLAPDWIATDRALEQLSRLTEAERRRRPTPIPLDVICDHVMACIRDEHRAGTVTVIELDGSTRRLG